MISESEEVTIRRGRPATFEPFTTGVLEITSEPAGARVEIDGRYSGTTPVTLELPAGSVEVALSKEGHLVRTATVEVARGKRIQEVFSLSRMPEVPDGFVLVEAGTFTMGSPRSEAKRDDDERQHRVTISQGFMLSEKEVTHAQFIEFLNDVGASSTGFYNGNEVIDVDDDDCALRRRLFGGEFHFKGSDNAATEQTPVIEVTWYGAVEYCNWLSRQEGLTPAYRVSGSDVTCNREADGYRLPTEAEWEYAARGGREAHDTVYAGSNDLSDFGWYSGNSGGETHPVATKRPNELGLYDMSGNVWEWCWDWYGDYPTGAVTDPTGPSTGSYRVLRGGGWYNSASFCRVAVRYGNTPSSSSYYIGFRPARTVQ